MGSFFRVLLATTLTGIGLGLLGGFGGESVPVAGMPAVCVAVVDTPCWLAFGGGRGVLVVGLAGVGLVSLTVYGAGLFFATGQLAIGGIAIGQVGAGVIAWIGQLGGGMTGIGQLIFGWLVAGQLPIGSDGSAFHKSLAKQLSSVLGPLGSRYELDA